MTHVIRLRAEAEDDIYEAAAWYESQRLRLGHDFLDALEASFARISENPLQFPVLYRGPGEHCFRGFHLVSFSELKVKISSFLLSCTQAAIQFVGVNEHNKSLKADTLKGAV